MHNTLACTQAHGEVERAGAYPVVPPRVGAVTHLCRLRTLPYTSYEFEL